MTSNPREWIKPPEPSDLAMASEPSVASQRP